jgi:hypothetical protein
LKLNDAMNILQHNLDLLTESVSVVNAQKDVSSPTELMAEPTRQGKAGANYRGPAVQKGPRGPNSVEYVFLFLCNIIICRFTT